MVQEDAHGGAGYPRQAGLEGPVVYDGSEDVYAVWTRHSWWLRAARAPSVMILVAIPEASVVLGIGATIGSIIALSRGVAARIDGNGGFGRDPITITWAGGLGMVRLCAGGG